PTSPQIFHGRELELRDLLDTLKQDSARVAILGMGGIGKTSLATAALHHIDVTTKYTRRYFVSCATVTTHRELISNIGSHLGLDQSSNLAKKIIRELSASFSSLLILDNLETPWEPPSSREEVEDFLSLLSDVSNLAIVITMRGAERPGKVKWTRPFLGPLKPLENSAALKTFADIADVDEVNETEHIAELLKLTDNLPLAVNLIANVASYEGCSVTLARWKEEKTNLLSEGHDKRSSLDISIMLSVTSPRVVSTPGAQDLLSVLSILPDGLSDIDLLQSNLPIPNILKAKSGLIRTSLAYTDRDQRVKVLNPIREYVRTVYPPSVSATRPLRQHFHNLVKLWVNFGQLESKNIIYRTTANLANLNSLLLEGLQSNPPDIEDSIRCIFSLNYFCTATSRGLSPLMSQVPSLLDRLDNRQLLGLYLIELFNSVYVQRIFDPAAAIRQGDQYFENSTVLEQGKSIRFFIHRATLA
ncbi:P-loop containing nucleoside triphosphate hydrolase protein, partial [Mycena sp. CBHHK59/15]